MNGTVGPEPENTARAPLTPSPVRHSSRWFGHPRAFCSSMPTVQLETPSHEATSEEKNRREETHVVRRPTMTNTLPKDPVCGVNFESTPNAARSEYKGQTYYFCCSRCKTKFDHVPEQYLSESGDI